MDIQRMRADGMSMREIGEVVGLPRMAIARMIWGGRSLPKPLADNDNKVIKMMPHNGGCSTTSGLVPVSVARVSFLDGAQREAA